MKNVLLITVLFVLVFIFSGFALAQKPIPRSSLETPVLPFERSGLGEQVGTKVINHATGRVQALFGMAEGPYAGTLIDAARQYLMKNIDVTGYNPDDLNIARVVESQDQTFVTFKGKIGNLPIYPGEAVVTFDRQSRVVFLFNSLIPTNLSIRTGMVISSDFAMRLARDYIKPTGKDLGTPSVNAVVWAGDDNPRPAWKVTLPVEDPMGDWEVLVDGNSGEVFRVRNNIKSYVDGSGYVFNPDPLTTASAAYGSTGFSDNSDANSTQLQAQRVSVTLRDITLTGSVYSLVGPWVNILDFESPTAAPVTSTTAGGFTYTRDASGFEDVMTYYQIDTAQRWIQSLGFTNIQHASIAVDPHGLSGADNSHYIPSTNRIAFGEGGVDDAEDADVIWHEYGHAIQESSVPGWGGGDEDAMGEGFGDYWAGSYSYSLASYNNTWVFNWDGHNPYWDGRLLNAGSTYPTNNTDIYSGGQIWSQACYDTRNRPNVGRSVMDRIVLQHHFSLGTTSTMPTGAAAILTTDQSLYGGIHKPDVYTGFVPRGLLSSAGSIACIAPNGGESWNAGTTQTISWSYYNLTGNVEIQINRSYPGATWETITNTTALSANSYAWTVTGPASTTARIRVRSATTTTIADTSNANFTVIASGPSITVTVPNGGEAWIVGDANNITWSSANLSENVKIDLNRTYPGATWETIIASTSNTGTYPWTVTGAVTSTARVRITGVTSTTVGDTSNGNFTIGTRSLTVTLPNGGESWVIGDANNITWTSANMTGENVKIELNRAYPGASWETIIASATNSGTYAWTVTGAATAAARVRISGVTHTAVGDSSNNNFTIAQRSVNVTAPNGGETWIVGDANAITWTSANMSSENVKIELNRSYPGATWETVTASTANSGTFAWTLTGAATSAARIRITGVTHTTIGDTSNANFTIALRSIVVTAPNGGETWLISDANNITWTTANFGSENVKIELNRAYPGATWETLIASTSNGGTYAWTVTGAATTTARVRVTGVTHTTIGDTSNANFSIAQRVVVVTAPNGGENWILGDSQNITWTAANFGAENVKIELKRDYPSATAWETIVASTANSGSYPWTVAGTLTTTARVRISGVTHTTTGDTSNTNFTIGNRVIAVTSPNGSEVWTFSEIHNITWTSSNITGNVNIDINRDYPGGIWENLATGLSNGGVYPWPVTLPATTLARVRVTSVTYPSVSDISDNDFTVFEPNTPAEISHDPLHDQNPAAFTVTALVTDNNAGFVTRFVYKLATASLYDSLVMAATVNANEYFVSVGPLASDSYTYFVRTIDAGGLVTTTPEYGFEVGEDCGTVVSYDDGEAELSNWALEPGFRWAVKFDHGVGAFTLCQGQIGISALYPSTAHSPILVEVYLADGAGGMPGTVVYSKTVGSVGNVIGGLAADPANWSMVVFRDETGNPLQLTSDFFVAVSNPDSASYEAFLTDTSSTRAGRSYFYSPCDDQWFSELSGDSAARPGNRMIRISGYTANPPVVVIHRSGNDLQLNWNSTGSPYYKIYSSTTSDGPFTTLEGSTSTNSFVDVNAVTEPAAAKYYIVYSTTAP